MFANNKSKKIINLIKIWNKLLKIKILINITEKIYKYSNQKINTNKFTKIKLNLN